MKRRRPQTYRKGRPVNPIRGIVEQQFKAAAAEGALYELRMRLLADKVPELQEAAYGEKLQNVERLIVRRFSDVLSSEEKTLFEQCRQLRNKLLHCDFHAVRRKLAELGANPQKGDVKRLDISGLTGAQMGERITGAASNVPGSFELVSDTAAKAGTVFGWLFDAGAGGNFVQATEAFTRAAQIVDRLAMI
jgi:hypothetical protein